MSSEKPLAKLIQFFMSFHLYIVFVNFVKCVWILIWVWASFFSFLTNIEGFLFALIGWLKYNISIGISVESMKLGLLSIENKGIVFSFSS
jgi:hypothetical protein